MFASSGPVVLKESPSTATNSRWMNAGDRPAERLMEEASTSVSFSAFMTGVVTFFAGLLLTRTGGGHDVDRVPLILLFMSIFGFLYSTLMYSNATGNFARLDESDGERALTTGNALSEFLGVYGLVLAMPLAVLAESRDLFLSITVLALAGGGFLVYHALGHSILDRYASHAVAMWMCCAIIILNCVQFVLLDAADVIACYVVTLGLVASLSLLLVRTLTAEEHQPK